MGELYNFLLDKNITSGIITVLLFTYLFLSIYSDWEVLVRLFQKIKNHFTGWPDRIKRKKKDKYEQQLQQKEFISFQKKCLLTIYEPLVEKLSKQGYPINIVEFESFKDGEEKDTYKYEAITIGKKKTLSYPFEGLFPKKDLTPKTPSSKEELELDDYDSEMLKNNSIPNTLKRSIKKYANLMLTTIRFPKRLGYMLLDINFTDHDITSVSAKSNCYMTNIIDSHYMEYELYEYYKEYMKTGTLESFNKQCEEPGFKEVILDNLPIRKQIHDSFKSEGNEEKVLISGRYRNSLMGVQALLLLKNRSGSYDAVSIRRSMNVVNKPGFIQYIPSGGFEALNDKDDIDTQRSNYSVNKALFRELAEECFGLSEDVDWDNKSSETIYYQNGIKELLVLLNESGTNKKAQFEFLGTTMNLVGLRQEFSFILRIDDDSFIEKLVANYESNNTINLIDINNLYDKQFWKNKHDNGCAYNDFDKLNCTSAGLLTLARENHLFQEARGKGK